MKVSVIFGTRPEAIKLAPVILELKKHNGIECDVCVTAQHREMLDQVLKIFNIVPDTDLNLMKPNQSLARLTALAVTAIDEYLENERPDLVLVQGDTTTVLSASLAAFYHKIPIGHVEAGLRTGNMGSPWPEEANRVLTSHLARIHFAPTEISQKNLLREGISPSNIVITGNTVIDALFIALKKIKEKPLEIPGITNALLIKDKSKIVLITGHRRENFGKGFESICVAISELARSFPDVHFVYPVHLNPNVRSVVFQMLSSQNTNIHLIDPLPYLPFVALLNRATFILTDSGGIQEEAPSLGKPVLVMRDTSERPEAIKAGTAKLVGTASETIVREATILLTNLNAYESMVKKHNPYGDGKAAERIVDTILKRFL
jgi:UDP-N-acetylglucosamine 2-epimerase (non-hydrolysing)